MVNEADKADPVSTGEDVPTLGDEAAATEDAALVEAPESSQTLKDLVILPPLQKSGSQKELPKDDVVFLPPIRVEEPISSIRQALSEVCGYAHITNFRLVIEDPPKDLQSNNNGSNPIRPITSPYTGPDAVVSVPVSVKSLTEETDAGTLLPENSGSGGGALDDFADMRAMLPYGLRDGSGLRIVLERYDTALVKDHVVRLRSLLEGNAPAVVSLDDGASQSKESPPAGEVTKEDSERDKEKENKEKEKQKDLKKEPPKDMPVFPAEKSAAINTSDFKYFFYHACGEEPALYSEDRRINGSQVGKENGSKSKKKNKKGKDKTNKSETLDANDEPKIPSEQLIRETIPKLNALEEKTRVQCIIRFSGFHPPPPHRRLMGDLVYLEALLPGNSDPVHVTAISTGFYVNKSVSTATTCIFDPSPAAKPCFSHELLDCLLQYSNDLQEKWKTALEASKARAELTAKLNEDGPFYSLFRVAIRGDFTGYNNPSVASAEQGIDALIQSPSWLVPVPKVLLESDKHWTKNAGHMYNTARTEDSLSNNFGIDIRGGVLRDWNEELQSAREMEATTILEKIERARLIYKVLYDFGEAALFGVKAISEGQIGPMNPNEPTRSQVYLHNNIFFSRAVDAGIETFKVAKGDKAARKSASRDVQSLGALHRMDRSGLYTLATVLIDYLGTRYVCQSILPGILSGDKTHTLLYGAVEAGSPLNWDKEMHELLEDTLGQRLMLATRPLPREPLSPEQVKEIKDARAKLSFQPEEKEEEHHNLGPTISACAPIEAKGIKGSDQRNYVLDMTRVTPRDANWISSVKGGTSRWEDDKHNHGKCDTIPKEIDDDEWTLAVLRPELLTTYAQTLLARRVKEKEKAAEAEQKEKSEEDKPVDKTALKDKNDDDSKKKALSVEDVEYFKSIRFNVNVFLPDIVSLEGIDKDAYADIAKDEELVRDVSKFLWDEMLPRITMEVRQGSWQQIHDGKALTRFLHQNGVNCRYLGRLATLAHLEEEKDRKREQLLKQSSKLDRHVLPLCWLELLETEMVARAAKHVLDRYMAENGGTAAMCPIQTVASFLSALISDGEETAAQTEKRIGKRGQNDPDEDELSSLTFFEGGGDGDAISKSIRGRFDVWKDIEIEIGRRFRYSLIVFNRQGKSPRARYASLLRRVCQRTGVRLAAKSYRLGEKCLCSVGGAGGQIMESYPISPVDIVDIVPLMKHSAAFDQGFVACGLGPVTGLPPLHILLPEVRQTLETARMEHNHRQWAKALDLAQEACGLYQRVTESPTHPGVVHCLDLMASILYDAGEPVHGAANALKSLGLSVQINGFDTPEALISHSNIFQMLISTGEFALAAKHMRAAIYLMDLLAGPNHVDIANSFHKLANLYSAIGDHETALKLYREASARQSPDRLMEGMIWRGMASVLSQLGEYKEALENEKRSYSIFAQFLGENHQLTKGSDANLKALMSAALSYGNKKVERAQLAKEEAAALAIAREMEAEEAAEEEKKKKKGKKKKGKK